MASSPSPIRIFLSSPGDVADERALANRLIVDDLPYDASFRGRVTLEIIAWERKGSPPMEAGLSPQDAINLGLPMPSECDIVVVILWSRMGTPLTYKDVKYKSGTHFEYENAIEAYRKTGKPRVLVYWRNEDPNISLDDPKLDEKREQRLLVKEFLDHFKDADSGELVGGYNTYASPSAFREKLEDHLRFLLEQLLGHPVQELPKSPATSSVVEFWSGSPFPGLRAFTPTDALIFFGRGREIDALLKKISESRFVAVVGSSGSGKSSLVGAGLIPRLKNNALVGSQNWLLPDWYEDKDKNIRQWTGLRFTPGEVGDNPFMALATKLAPMVGSESRSLAGELEAAAHDLSTVTAELSMMANERRVTLTEFERMAQDQVSAIGRDANTTETEAIPEALRSLADRRAKARAKLTAIYSRVLNDKANEIEILIFIDQFEELFTLVRDTYRPAFMEMLVWAAGTVRLRTVITMRSDFYHRCVDYPTLARLLENGSYPLSVPTEPLLDMIVRPAQRAGLEFEEGLTTQILKDTGYKPGALALMAYALDELYKLAKQHNGNQLTHEDYKALKGVQGAIGKRAESVFSDLKIDQPEEVLQRVFRELVEVDERGTATRRRVPQNRFVGDQSAQALIRAFTDARLLTTSGETGEPMVEVAHEALFTNWKMLAEWIVGVQDDLRLVRQFERDAHDWERRGKPSELRPRNEQLKLLLTAAEHLKELIQTFRANK